MKTGIIVLAAAIGITAVYFVSDYNRLVVLRNRIENAFSQIDVQLKRRSDLIPKLVESVKGYAKYEKGVLKEITAARAMAEGARSVSDKAKADVKMESALKTFFAVAESYPKLRANENFLLLQEEISGTENKIAYSRQFYNDTVMHFNSTIQMFPTAILASIFRFQKRDFFKAEESEKADVKMRMQ